MTPERWRRIENVYHAALLRDPAERGAFVAEACRADEELQRRIESMLAQDSDGAILDMPAAEVLPDSVVSNGVADGRFGPYAIVSRLGKGGMGEVFRAHDSRLKRDVALKVSARQFTDRFGREARAIAALNHPHICTLHDVGPNYLVMEYVEGKPPKGPMPPEQAIRRAMEIAEALEHAHRHGIVHRDLKPDNILLTKQGVKLLDFGLAKKVAPLTSESDATSMGALTAEGTVVGTPQYMAPEQIEGRDADTRTDIFAFGCVLYEMLTGHRAFDGKSQASVISKILQGEPKPVRELQPTTPPALDRVLRMCLAKDPDERWQTAGDLLRALRLVEEEPGALPTSAKRPWVWQAVAVAAVIAAAVGVLLPTRPNVVVQPVQFTVEAPENTTFSSPTNGFALSPDGRLLAFTAGSTLWLRPLNSLIAQPLPGTEDSASPFWSPDSRSLAFFAGGKLKRVDIAGGNTADLCDATIEKRPGGAWGPNGVILFAGRDGLHRVPASGGLASLLTRVDPSRTETGHSVPQFLPDGTRFIYLIESADPAVQGIYIASLDQPAGRRRLLATDSKAIYAPPFAGHPGYLVWNRGLDLLAQRLNTAHLTLEGEPVPVAQDVGVTLFGAFYMSDAGVLALLHSQLSSLVWMNAAGETLKEEIPKDKVGVFRLNPDGKSVIFRSRTATWLHDILRGTNTRVVLDPTSAAAVLSGLSRNGYMVSPGTNGQMNALDVGASRPPRPLTFSPNTKYYQDWSRDGKYVLYDQVDEFTGFDEWAAPVAPGGKPFPVVRTPFYDAAGRFSPDGKWIVYGSTESGRSEIYLQPFPEGTRRWQVSNQGGNRPVWRGDSKEIYFIGPELKLMGAAVRETATGIETDTPQPIFTLPGNPGDTPFDVTADGRRFLVRKPYPLALQVIVNWQAGLK